MRYRRPVSGLATISDGSSRKSARSADLPAIPDGSGGRRGQVAAHKENNKRKPTRVERKRDKLRQRYHARNPYNVRYFGNDRQARKEPVMLRVSTALTFSALLVSSIPAAAADNAKTVDVHQGHRADLPGEMRGVPSARQHGADVARSPTKTRGRGRSRLPRASPRGRCRRGTSTRRSASRSSRTIAR